MKKVVYSYLSSEHSKKNAQKKLEEHISKTVATCTYDVWPTSPFDVLITRYEGAGYLCGVLEHRFHDAKGSEVRLQLRPNQNAAFYLLYSKADNCHFHQQGHDYKLKKNSLLLLNYLEACSFASRSQEFKIIGFGASEQIARDWIPPRAYQQGRIIPPSNPWAQSIFSILSMFDTSAMDDIDGSNRDLADAICCYLSLCLNETTDKMSSYKETLLQRLRKSLHDHFRMPKLSAGSLSKEVGISQRTLHATFGAAGSSFQEELMLLRLNHAKGLLAESGAEAKPIQDIAAMSGFSHRNNFLNAFKRHLGVPPSVYRKGLKK